MALRPFLLFVISITQLHAQSVYNDDIENRHPLKINDRPYISHTEECTVQKECLNIALTDQCLIYHNDQWFEFTTLDSGDYYINIRNQECRDVRGVQAVIIDGEPCMPESYEILDCVSNGHQDDMYIKLNLSANKTYLMIIDGYLHDYCYFDIDVSTDPPIFALLPDKTTFSDTIFTQNPIVQFQWTMDTFEAEQMQEYQILRRHDSEKKSKIVWSTPNLRNSFGEPFVEFNKYDTLNETLEGSYFYKISGMRQDSSQLLIQDILVVYKAKDSYYDPAHDYIQFELPKSKRKTPYSIVIKDAKTNVKLDEKRIEYDKLFSTIKLDIKNYRTNGILEFNIEINNLNSGELKILEFSKPHKYLKKSKIPELF
ncbi:hypothetical protein HZR84_13065 [Hyphobacterium sp. CCMP332]|nr:hypothetical protein HZR84_13065 [Hyphobacterium sp. CCMP332]